jgi:hypothetical protein
MKFANQVLFLSREIVNVIAEEIINPRRYVTR